MNMLPLIRREAGERFAYSHTQQITTAQFCADVMSVAESLPDQRYLINLCQDRYTFITTFFAALVRKQTNLLPSNRDLKPNRAHAEQFPSLTIVADDDLDGVDHVVCLDAGKNGSHATPICDAEHLAAIAFTSGSTGEPQQHAKSFAMLDTWRQIHARYLKLAVQDEVLDIVATVPSWHMYGLEWAMLLPTVASAQIFCGADFFPKDVVQAINASTNKVILVSTPLHLKALSKTQAPSHPVATIISATAPLDEPLMRQIEAHLNSQVFEIYGCSEIGSLAYRFPAQKPAWTFFDCFDLQFDDGEMTVNHTLLDEPVKLADHFERAGESSYQLKGRTTDIVKVGGKRESLARLNSILNQIPGVEDGVIYDPVSYQQAATGRLAALVVAPELDRHAIRTALSAQVDTAFIPRPIRLVDALPRSATSKLQQRELTALINQLRSTDD